MIWRMGLAKSGLAVMAGMAALVAAPAVEAKGPSKAALDWYGTYEHTETVPRSGGMTGTVETKVILDNNGCTLRAQGVMTDTTLKCTARIRGNSLVVGFKSYPDGSVRNVHNVAVYQPSETLLTFTRTPQGLVTKWQGYTLSNGNTPTGKYFTKKLR